MQSEIPSNMTRKDTKMERQPKSNYEPMRTCGSSPKPTLEVHGIKTQNTTDDEGWTPELLIEMLAAIELSLERQENRELWLRMRESGNL